MTKPQKDTQTKYNILVSILYQLVAASVGLILPRFILSAYGSEINGIVQSVNQFLSYTVMLECGLGGMIAASFYKPLAYGDNDAVTDIFINTKKFFSRIVAIYFVFIIAFALSSKLLIHTSYDKAFVSSLVFVLGISNYFSYYFAMSEQLLLKADQKIRISQALQIAAIVLNALVCIAMIKLGAGIHVMKIASGVCFLITPIGLKLYTRKHYSIGKTITDKSRRLPKKSDGIAHHISFFIHNNTDMVIINIFNGVKEVSVYAIYTMVTVAIGSFLKAIANGIAAKLGNIIAKDAEDDLNDTFEIYYTANMALSTYSCIMLALFIVPFVQIYTSGVTDTNYVRPVFAYLLVITEWISFIRIPYYTAITSAGHYGQTKGGAVAEAAVNIVVSLILVYKMGINGVVIGTLTAVAVRTVHFVWYLSRNILNRSAFLFIRSCLVNLTVAFLIIFVAKKTTFTVSENIIGLLFEAVLATVAILPIVAAVNILENKALRRKTGALLLKVKK